MKPIGDEDDRSPNKWIAAGVGLSVVLSFIALGLGASAYHRSKSDPVTSKSVTDALRNTPTFDEGSDSRELFFTGYDRTSKVAVSIPVGHFVVPDFTQWFGELASNSSARSLEGSILMVPAIDSGGAWTWFRMSVPADPSATSSASGGGGISGGGGGTATGMAGP